MGRLQRNGGELMKLTMLGTGNALVTECYNTCFVVQNGKKHLLVDGGGGNTLLAQLKHAGFDWMDMREIFVTHKHVDHLMGIVWMIRMICQYMRQGQYQGEAWIYGHDEVISDSERNGRQASFRKRDVFYREQAAYGSGRRRGRAHSYKGKR